MKEWQVGLSSWIIQDGNYPDFVKNQEAEFALEYYSTSLRSSANFNKNVACIRPSIYRVNAEVVSVGPNHCVIDFGILAFLESAPTPEIKGHAWVNGEICLGVDPFFYFESMCKNDGIPELIYHWRIRRIELETTPLVETTDSSGRRVLVRDEATTGFREIERTDAWKDDNGHANYILFAELLDNTPRRAFRLR